MAHINYNRNVLYSTEQSLSTLLPDCNAGASFAAFGGSDGQRRAVGLRAISRCFGKMGIVVLQNNRAFAASLGRQLKEITGLGNTHTYHVNPPGDQCYYDPFYGLSSTGVLDILAPTDSSGYGAVSAVNLRRYLSTYLEIMQIQFRKSPELFGQYPYSLDLLIELTHLPIESLRNEVLSGFSPLDRDRIYSDLFSEDAQNKTAALVINYANELNNRLWNFRGFQNRTRLSVIEVVKQHSLICINVPAEFPEMLRTIAEELKELRNAGVPFLLVACDAPLSATPIIRQMFTDPHENVSYSTGLIFENPSNFYGQENNELAMVMGQHHEILLFNSANALLAEPFAQAFGSYHRIVRENNYSRNRRPFSVFSSTGYAENLREVTEPNINTEELTRLGGGAVLCGKLYPTPIVIQNVRFD